MKTRKRILLTAGILVVAAIILTVVFISPIAKFLFEKYSKSLLGRKIVTERLTLNLLTGSIAASGLKIFEPNDTGFAVTCGKLDANISLRKLLHLEVDFNKMKLYSPDVKIAQDGNRFSFRDIVQHLSPKKGNVIRSPVNFRLENFSIDSGRVYYENIPVKRIDTFEHVNFSFTVIARDVPDISFHIDFTSINGGDVNADLVLQKKSLDYLFHINITQFNLAKYYMALRSMLNVASLNGFLNANLRSTGNFRNKGAVALSGDIVVDSVVIKDHAGVVFTSFHQFQIGIDSLNAAKNIFNFRQILLDEPYFRFDKFSNGNNVSRMLVQKKTKVQQPDEGSSVEDSTTSSSMRGSQELDYSNMFTLIWSYAKFIVTNFTISNYSADSVLLRDGFFIYNDYSMEDRFSYDVNDLTLESGAISSANNQVRLGLNAILNHHGAIDGSLVSSPDFRHLQIDYTIQDIRVPDFNPYSRHYLATPFFDGVLNYTSHALIDSGLLNSENIIVIHHLVAGKKIDKEPVHNWPVRTSVSLLKDKHGVINLNIPVAGDLNDPDYQLKRVLLQILDNLFGKAMVAPSKMLVNAFGGGGENVKEIPFDYMQRDLGKSQYKDLDKVAKVLAEKPEFNVTLTQLTDKEKELEELALYEAKKRYYAERVDTSSNKNFSKKVKQQLSAILNQDSLFNAYLNQKLKIKSSALISTQEKSIRLIGRSALDKELQELIQRRNDEVLRYLTVEKAITVQRVIVQNNRDPLKSKGLPKPRYLVAYSTKK